jgi:hypothetical protein
MDGWVAGNKGGKEIKRMPVGGWLYVVISLETNAMAIHLLFNLDRRYSYSVNWG